MRISDWSSDVCSSDLAGVALTTQRVGGMFGLFFSDEKVDTYAQAVACDAAAFHRFFHALLALGVYLAPSAYEAGFMSSAHDDHVIARTVVAVREAYLVARACAQGPPWSFLPGRAF